MEYFVNVSRGNGLYHYHWSTTPEDNDDVIFGCSTAFPDMGSATITVTDTAGDSVTGSRAVTCIGGQER